MRAAGAQQTPQRWLYGAEGDIVLARRIRKKYYLETRADVLLRNTEVFERWARLGLKYMFLGMEAIDAEGLDLYRKRVSPDDNFRALDVARRLGISVAINLIVDPGWDRERFRVVRDFALAVPEIVHLTVMTPYPGTEVWHTESRRLTTRDYRLFDIQHAVVPTALPLDEFYGELVRTQAVINRKHLGLRTAFGAARVLASNLARGQTNFARMLWRFNRVYNAQRQLADHARPVRYELPLPRPLDVVGDRQQLYIHTRPTVHKGQQRTAKATATDQATAQVTDDEAAFAVESAEPVTESAAAPRTEETSG